MNTPENLKKVRAMRAFIAQRSGMDYRNYGDRENFMGDYRPMLRAGRDARRMLSFCEWASVDLQTGTDAFSGRLQFATDKKGGIYCDYTTGQYFPTEYRRAACAVISDAIEHYARECGYDTREKILKFARKEFGRGIASRWFN